MSIFGFGKKKEEQKQPCCCGGSCTPEAMQAAEAEKNIPRWYVNWPVSA